MSKKRTIEASLLAKYKAINIANGYSFDLDADRVFNHKMSPVDSADFSVSIYAERIEIEDSEGYNNCALPVRVIMAGEYGGEADVDNRIADILKATALMESEIEDLRMEEINISYAEESETVEEIEFLFTFSYFADRWAI